MQGFFYACVLGARAAWSVQVMRLAHHLWRDTSGIWYFRVVVPRRLREALGRSLIKQSLRTRDPIQARAWSYVLSAKCAQIFAMAGQGGRGMGGVSWGGDADEPDEGDDLTQRLGLTVRKWEVETPDGHKVRTDGSQGDHENGMAALRAILERRDPSSGSATSPGSRWLTLDAAIKDYSEVEAVSLKPNTWAQRARALQGFVDVIGGRRQVSTISRTMASVWSDGLLRSGKSKVYVANCVSHVAQLFEALVTKGHLTTNPVKGLVVVKKKEKAARRSEGHEWEPFEVEQLQRIFDPANLVRTKMEHVRWGAVIALYTGARVGEIAQIFLRDFVTHGDTPCLKICADSDGQGIKTGEGGERLIPLHPDLIRLGLMERVEALRAAGAERLFPDMRIDSAAGRGNSITKGFGYYLKGLGITPRRAHGILGIHSLRKTVIQTLQGSSLSAERRRALVGHEAGDPAPDTHATAYMRAWTPKELAAYHPALPWNEWINIGELKGLLLLPSDNHAENLN
ncbi:site-specific integrase [Dyella sp. EPa41]|uniref:site-specific integrase n=1 Tax=Dyella sp. EPa41 TaxID=1561194 RepID=UPI0019159138|nr:site-specific integrase [Dyella sp. EPa41]